MHRVQVNFPEILLDVVFVVWLKENRQLSKEASPEKLYREAYIPLPPCKTWDSATAERVALGSYEWAEKRRIEMMNDYLDYQRELQETVYGNYEKDYDNHPLVSVGANS
jgi:hypothetical protein